MSIFICGTQSLIVRRSPTRTRMNLVFTAEAVEFAEQSMQVSNTALRTTNDQGLTPSLPSLPLPSVRSLRASLAATSSGSAYAPDPVSPGTLRRRGFRKAASLSALSPEPPTTTLLQRRTARLQSRRSRVGRRTLCNRSGRLGTSSPAPTGRARCAEAEVRRPPAARHRKSSRCPQTSTPENSYAPTDPQPLLHGADGLSRAPTAACFGGSGSEQRCAIRPQLLRGVPAP